MGKNYSVSSFLWNKSRFILIGIILSLVILLVNSKPVFAMGNSFITIVNPVRISSYIKDPDAGIKAEYEQISSRSFPATWLLTYDVLERKSLIDRFAQMDKRQEMGIFLEIGEDICKKAGVVYNATNSWHRATSLFLSGYTDSDREKLIDAVFIKFKNSFGYYPKSVGGWWVDSYSLAYMQKKYKITGVLGISDQYDLDGYQLWGTYWSVPYYPSKINAAIPAHSEDDKLDVVTFRWAPRDPLNGYSSPSGHQASLYSNQDYEKIGLGLEYYKALGDVYLNASNLNEYGQETIGLEADYLPETFSTEFSKRLDVALDEQSSGVDITSMSEFADWYRNSFTKTSPPQIVLTDDLLGTPNKIIWYQNDNYRIGILANHITGKTQIIDLRVYPKNLVEPFYISPNGQYNLYINIPYVIDSVIDKKSKLEFKIGDMIGVDKNGDGIILKFEKGNIMLSKDNIGLPNIAISKYIFNSKQIEVKKNSKGFTLNIKSDYFIPSEGLIIKTFGVRLPFALLSRLKFYKVQVSITIITLLFAIYFLFKSKRINAKFLPAFSGFLIIAVVTYLLIFGSNKYYISQSEVEGLKVLADLPTGAVLIYEKDCLRCTFVTPIKPAAAAGEKSYIKKWVKGKVVYDLTFETAATSKIARDYLTMNKISYIYLVKYESYIESLPYLPQDLKLVRIYENANSVIYKVE